MPHEQAEVVILGSGGAALVAACAAADGGREVAVLERADVLGGTTAVSGGMLWVGDNPLSERIGITDSREATLRYLTRVVGPHVAPELLEAVVDTGPELVRYLLEETPVRLFPIDRPDYHAHWDGGREGGRVLDNEPFDVSAHDELAGMVREGSHFPPLTYEERHRWRWPERFDWQLIAERMTGGVRTLGGALAAALVQAARDRGVRFVTGVRARELVMEQGRVTGVRAEVADTEQEWRAGAAVVLATGGFEWNEEMTRSFLRGPTRTAVSPPVNFGDGLRMAMRAGAVLDNMSEAWWAPTYQVPGEEYDGRVMSRHLVDELALPGSIMVNRQGRRFVNEATNYNDISKLFHVFDPAAYGHPNTPSWMIFDHRVKSTYAVATVMGSDAAPPWFQASDTLRELAGKIGVHPEGLAETVDRFNAGAREGIDPEFGRGRGALDRYYGDDELHDGPNPSLGTIERGPFYAIEVLPGLLGTKGGARTDTEGRVLRADGAAVPGLYAISNAAASPMGIGYPGAGGSLGPLLTMGLRCGRALGRS